MRDFTPIASTLGGILIGLSAATLLYVNGRIAGVSGVVGRAVTPSHGDRDQADRSWRLLFIAGLLVGGLGFVVFHPSALSNSSSGSMLMVAVAGLLVGFGTRLGGGCPSGHGVCGIGRLSTRSVVATLTFMLTGAATVYVVRHLLGGAS